MTSEVSYPVILQSMVIRTHIPAFSIFFKLTIRCTTDVVLVVSGIAFLVFFHTEITAELFCIGLYTQQSISLASQMDPPRSVRRGGALVTDMVIVWGADHECMKL